MNFYKWETPIDKDECEALISEYKDRDFTTAMIGAGNMNQSEIDSSTRKTDIIWIDSKKLINRAIWSFILEANDNYFNYYINGFEQVQFGRYGIDDYYGWHRDNTNFDPKAECVRKLSLTVQLSDPDSYEGGEFQFFDGEKEAFAPEIKKQGSVIVFDCNNWHRVTPVKKGVRYSIVMWAVGANFK
tara:strand:- start:82 stop:639 length:558 start_codon:yes stop_codon:yes gene_type:complete